MDFQLTNDAWLLKNKYWLFKKGTRLFVKGDSGVEALHVQMGQTVSLQLASVPSSPVSIRSSDPKLKVTGPDAQNRITITANDPVTSMLTGHDGSGNQITPILWVSFGKVEKHTGMDIDLIADLLSGSDPVRIHAMHRFLNNNDDTIFNENWQAIIDHRGRRACGTVAKDGSQALWRSDPDKHSFRSYHIPFPVPRPPAKQFVKVTDRKQVKFKENTLTVGRQAIAAWLQKNKKPVVVGVIYGPTSGQFLVTNRFGNIERTGLFGHTVMIVGCDKSAENFLYIDPWHGGSQMVYEGGIIAASKFLDKCSLGMLSLDRTNLATRGPVLRQTLATEGSFNTGNGLFLELISGP